jgi:hypothetical protein
MQHDVGNGWRSWQTIPRLAGGIVATPIVVMFVALGAAVVITRSVRDVAREAWSLLPGRRRATALPDDRGSRAA